METSAFICTTCGAILAPDDVFCSHCGAKVTLVSATIGIGKQIYIYGVSLLVPPFGLIYTWKYVRNGTPQQKRIGWLAFALTVISIFLTVWATVGFLQGIQSQLNAVSSYQEM